MERTSLEDALKGEVQKVEKPEPQEAGGGAPPADTAPAESEAKPAGSETPKPQGEAEDEDRPRDPKTGRFSENVPYASYKSEKTKRKELEKQQAEWAKEREALAKEAKALREWKAQVEAQSMQAPRQHQPRPRPQMPDPVTDPQGYNAAIGQMLAHERFSMRIESSEDRAIDKYGSEAVNAAKAALFEMENRLPGFATQFRTRDPVGDVVRWHLKQRAIEEIGDPKEYRTKLREEIIAELKAAPPQQQAQQPKVVPKLPTDLSGAPNVGTRTGSTFSGPTNLSDILPR